MTKFTMSRDVTPEECPWLEETVKARTVVYRYSGATYGCIGAGMAVTLEDGRTPFFEIPRAALNGEETV